MQAQARLNSQDSVVLPFLKVNYTWTSAIVLKIPTYSFIGIDLI